MASWVRLHSHHAGGHKELDMAEQLLLHFMGMIPIPIFLGEVFVMIKKKNRTSIVKCYPNTISLKPETQRKKKKKPQSLKRSY